jgi:hypothetical protein
MKVYLTVDAWISIGERETRTPQIPFGAHDSKNAMWSRILLNSQLACVDCGQPITRGWRRGLKGKTAVCDLCVVLNDPHRSNP